MGSYRKFLFVFTSWWALWFVVHAGILYLLGYPLNISLADSLVSNLFLSLTCLALVNILKYYQPRSATSWNLLFWSTLLAAKAIIVVYWSMSTFYDDYPEYIRFLKQSMPVRYCFSFLMIGCLLLLSWMWNILRTQKEEMERKADIEKIAKDAELNRLRQQMQPHFLFNSLNSISALIGSNPSDARAMVQNLSAFMRYTLKKEAEKMTTLEEEFEHLQLYLDIEKQRFGHRLNIGIKIDESLLKFYIPFLILQPIVENAIKFGLYGTTGECTITLCAKAENKELVITITNPFDNDSREINKGTGFGISSTQRRLYLLFGRNDLLQTRTEENTFVTELKIPQPN